MCVQKGGYLDDISSDVVLQVPLAAAYLPPALLLALPCPQARDLAANLIPPHRLHPVYPCP